VADAPALDLHFVDEAVSPDLVAVTLDDLSPSAIHETDASGHVTWRIFFQTAARRDAALTTLRNTHRSDGLEIAAVDVPDEDWAARSQAALRSIRVGRVVVAPPWDRPLTGNDPVASSAARDVVVVIRPSMGFGTGHHETTRLCLRLLQDAALADRSVLDVGTGSGVLALAADALGAESSRGIDVDPDAIESARENWTLNGCSPRVHFEVADASAAGAASDVVLANLTGALLRRIAHQLISVVRPGGALVISGFQIVEADEVLAAFAPRTSSVRRVREGDWEAALLTL
jgi:ribosomal protein L11 methyltransferase